MSRRIVQDLETGKPVPRQCGYVYQKGRKKGDPWNPKERGYGRYRIDVPGEHGQKEVRVALGYCRNELDAMLRLQEEMKTAGVLDLNKVRERLSPVVDFRTQAAWWLEAITSGEVVHSKKRTQIVANTIGSYSTAIAYLNEQIGDVPLASIDNPEAKALVTAMKSAVKDGRRRFSDSTISYYFRIMRQVISSQMDEKFRPVHRREWNLAAIGLPRVNPKNQRRPTMTPKEMTTLLGKAEGQYLMIYFLSLVTGMRISEAVAIEMEKHIEPDCSIIYVRQQREKDVNALRLDLKTEAGLRDIDLHPDAAQILRNFIGNRTSGFLFQTANGTMLDPGNIDRDSLSPILKTMGRDEAGTRFNVFRRFREAVLQRSEARQILIDYWMGHSNPSMGDRYGKQLVEDVEYRQEQAKKVGLGFDLPPSLFGLRGLQNVGNVRNEEAA
ncbi:MAG: site-specific integrase [Candidatus Acidiferrales bacterium]